MNLRRLQVILFFISIIIYFFYYVSAFFTQTLAPFFVWAGTGGMDFFQVPNGAYAFLHGGSLTGSLPTGIAPYTSGFCCGVNFNVYHPLFTFLIGVPLQMLPPKTAMAVWAFMHLFTMGILLLFFRKKFRFHKYLYLALSILLLFSYQYYEIWLDQYHFLFNFLTILFFYESITKGDTAKAGIWLFLGLLVKPIGLLWFIPLLLYKRFRTVTVGFGLFVLATCILCVFPFSFGSYYLHNFFSVAADARASANLFALQWLIPSFPMYTLKAVSILLGIGLFVLQIIKKPKLFTILTLWIGYQLLFYGLVFHYHYTVLAGIICLGILSNMFSPKSFVMIPVAFLTLPAPVEFLHLSGRYATRSQLAVIWLYTVFWLCCFLISLLFQVFADKRKALPNSSD